ncbi:DUF4157 domain-containing protein, partial [Azotobacter chroococcum]|nr:DUF4157 domain-containing protein [Azotobacter chroococcum]
MARHSAIIRGVRVAGILLALAMSMGAAAGGGEPSGEILDEAAPLEGIGLDELHRQIKALIPPSQTFGGVAEINEALAQTGAPVLQEMIVHSRDEALRNGVQPMPPDIRRQLAGFLPERVLNAARYRVQGGDDFTLQWNLIRYGEAQAIALDHVVIFKETSDALYNPTLWVHELTHVDQYQRWGIQEFAIRYLRNYEAVEREAYEAETRYVAWAKLHNRQKLAAAGDPTAERPLGDAAGDRALEPLPAKVASSTCGTAAATCRVTGSGPVGTPCWCNLPMGAAAGALVPDPANDNAAPPALPANACNSARGTCPLAVEIEEGSPCTCVMPEGSFSGSAERKSLGERCATYSGTCPLARHLLSG